METNVSKILTCAGIPDCIQKRNNFRLINLDNMIMEMMKPLFNKDFALMDV